MKKLIILLFLISACGSEKDTESEINSATDKSSIVGFWLNEVNDLEGYFVGYKEDGSCTSGIIRIVGYNTSQMQVSDCTYSIESETVTHTYTRSSDPEKTKENKWAFDVDGSVITLMNEMGIFTFNLLEDQESTGNMSIIFGYFDENGVFTEHEIIDL